MKTKIVLTAAAVIFFIAAMISGAPKNTAPEAELPTPSPEPEYVNRTLTVTAAGDCTFATDINADKELGFDAYAEKYGTDYFLSEIRGIFKEDDLTVVNFEGTLSDRGTREDKQFAFRGDPAYADILANASVEAANLANNHSSDYGSVSLEDTKTHLTNAGILAFRGGADVCVSEINGIRVGLVGINYLNDDMKTELADAITKAKDDGAEIVIASIHWGIEKATEPEKEQVDAAHKAVDCGADLVIGTHPHVLQGIEKYKGAYICYSLGNFCFGGNNARRIHGLLQNDDMSCCRTFSNLSSFSKHRCILLFIDIFFSSVFI